MRRRVPVRVRILRRLVIDPSSGCLLWQGALDKDGYGLIHVDGRAIRVHRATYEMFAEPIPPGLEPDHLCRIRRCAAPAHLELVTHKENMLRGDGIGSMNAAKTHCGTCGEPFDEANTYIMPSGGRDCRACIRARAARYKARKRAAARAARLAKAS